MEIDTMIEYFTENNISVNTNDIRTLKRYLDKCLEKGGSNNMRNIHNALNRFFRFTQTTNIQDISTEIILDYIDHLKNLNHKYNYIDTTRLMIGAFLNYYTKLHKKENFVNPMPDKTLYEIRKPILTGEEQEEKCNSMVYTIDELLLILKRGLSKSQGSINFVTREAFVMMVLQMMTGARESEIATIQMKNFHLEDRYFFTGNVDSANKNHKSLTFCFPKELNKILQLHLIERESQKKSSIWLFPGLSNKKDDHVNNHQLTRYMNNLFLLSEFAKPLVSHSLRRTLTTFRCCPSHIEETLSNHAVTSIIMKHYNLPNWKTRRDVYDRYFPHEYYPILKFLEE
jgi:integrase